MSSQLPPTIFCVEYAEHGSSQVLRFWPDRSMPELSRKKGLLIKVCAASVNALDVKLRKHPSLESLVPLPKVPGVDFSGVVVDVRGSTAAHFKVGDKVYGMLPAFKTHGGTFAEYIAVDATMISIAPTSIPLWQAASLPLVGLTVIQALRPVIESFHGEMEGKSILIHGGVGGVGSFAIAYCKHILHMMVTSTCSSSKVHKAIELGADQVIDYTKEEFESSALTFDIILDPLPFIYEKRSIDYLRKHNKDGHYIQILSSNIRLQPGDPGTDKLKMSLPEASASNLAHISGIKIKSWFFGPHEHFTAVHPDDRNHDLMKLSEWVDKRLIPINIDRTFSIQEASLAHDYVEQGHSCGKVIVKIDETL